MIEISNMDPNQPITTCRRGPFKPVEESPLFLRGPLEWITEAKKSASIFSYIFHQSPWCYCKRGNCGNLKKLLVDLLGVICKVLNRMVKHFAFLKNVCYQYLNFVLGVTHCFFLRAADWPTGNFLGMYIAFFRNPIGQLCTSGPGYSGPAVK